MLLEYVKMHWGRGTVSVGLPALGHGDKVTIEATGLPGLAACFLSQSEKAQLAEIVKAEAKAEMNTKTAIADSE